MITRAYDNVKIEFFYIGLRLLHEVCTDFNLFIPMDLIFVPQIIYYTARFST